MTINLWLQTTDLCRYYQRGDNEVRAVDKVSLQVTKGEFLSIVGASGSGKSTMLNLMAGLDRPTSGQILVDSRPLSDLSRKQLAAYRAHRVGIVFQSFNLISHRTALANVELALMFNHTPPNERLTKSAAILEKLGLSDRSDHFPADLSGGEQQRVAMARALVKQPEILFADEPTGNLDYDNSIQVANLLRELNQTGLTIVMVTHDMELANRFSDRIVKMDYGKIVDDGSRKPGERP